MRAFTITQDGILLRTSEARRRGLTGVPIAALTWELAMAQHATMLGKSFNPGPASACPKEGCSGVVYLEQTGECWRCNGLAPSTHWQREERRVVTGSDYHERKQPAKAVAGSLFTQVGGGA